MLDAGQCSVGVGSPPALPPLILSVALVTRSDGGIDVVSCFRTLQQLTHRNLDHPILASNFSLFMLVQICQILLCLNALLLIFILREQSNMDRVLI